MPVCILHVGMSKTGTSSIQKSLFLGLRDPRFRLVHLGHLNAAAFLEALFGDDPERFWAYRRGGLCGTQLRRMQRAYGRRLRNSLRRARDRGVTPIVSAERCWSAPRSMLERIRGFMEEEGFKVHVVAYLRPLRPWIESHIQQHLKLTMSQLAFGQMPDMVRLDPAFDVSGRLAELERVFGSTNLAIRVFTPRALVGGCVVRDFCSTVGIAFDDDAIVRANDSIRADAVRMLYCFMRFGRGFSELSLRANQLLTMQLERLGGDRFRLHPDFFASFDDAIARHERQVLAAHGLDLREEPRAVGEGSTVRIEDDLFRFSRDSLDWLARASGSTPVATGDGEKAARAVADQIDTLARRPDPRLRLQVFRDRLRLKWRWMRVGD